MSRALLIELERASGNDAALDEAIASTLGAKPAAYTASAESCVALMRQLLPGWHWHVGWGGNGIFPYVRLEQAGNRVRVEAPTVPLALLRAIIRASIEDFDRPAEAPPRPVWQR